MLFARTARLTAARARVAATTAGCMPFSRPSYAAAPRSNFVPSFGASALLDARVSHRYLATTAAGTDVSDPENVLRVLHRVQEILG